MRRPSFSGIASPTDGDHSREADAWRGGLMSRFTPRTASEWSAVLPAYLGMIGLAACFLVWALTRDHIYEPVFIGAFLTLMGVGAGARALVELRQPPAPQIPPIDPPRAEGVDRDAEGHL